MADFEGMVDRVGCWFLGGRIAVFGKSAGRWWCGRFGCWWGGGRWGRGMGRRLREGGVAWAGYEAGAVGGGASLLRDWGKGSEGKDDADRALDMVTKRARRVVGTTMAR